MVRWLVNFVYQSERLRPHWLWDFAKFESARPKCPLLTAGRLPTLWFSISSRKTQHSDEGKTFRLCFLAALGIFLIICHFSNCVIIGRLSIISAWSSCSTIIDYVSIIFSVSLLLYALPLYHSLYSLIAQLLYSLFTSFLPSVLHLIILSLSLSLFSNNNHSLRSLNIIYVF